MDEPFLGFSGDNRKSETYLRKFESFRKSLIPVVVLERLPKKYSCVGKGRKKVGDNVHSQRSKLRGSKISDHEIEAEVVEELECPSLIFNKTQKSMEGLKERERKGFSVGSASVSQVPQEQDVGEENSGQAQDSTEGSIKLNEKVSNKRVRGCQKRSNRSRGKAKSQLFKVAKSFECEKRPRRSLRLSEGNGSHKNDGESVPQIPGEGIKAFEGNQVDSVKSDSLIEYLPETQLPLNAVHNEELMGEDISIRVESCSKSSVPREIVTEKWESTCNQHPIKPATQLSYIETPDALKKETRCDESGSEVESQLTNFDCSESSDNGSCSTKNGLKLGARHSENECNGFYSGSNAIRQVPEEGMVDKGSIVQVKLSTNSEVLPGVSDKKVEIPSRFDEAAVEIESQLINVDSSRNSKDNSQFCSGNDQVTCCGLFMGEPSVQEVHNKIVAQKEEINQAHPTEFMTVLSGYKVENQLPDEVELNDTNLVDPVSLERNRGFQKENEETKISETRQEQMVQLGLVSHCKSAGEAESHFVMIDNSLKCDKILKRKTVFIQSVLDEAGLKKEERIQTQCTRNLMMPVEFNIEEAVVVQPQCSEKSELHHNIEQSPVFPHCENVLIPSTSKSIDRKERKDDIATDEDRSKPWSYKRGLVKAPSKIIRTLLRPCVVRLERMRDIEKMVRRAALDDTINYPVIVKGGQKIMGLRTRRRPSPAQQHSTIDKRPTRKQLSKTSLPVTTDRLTQIDLSDGMTLKKFCELNTISLIDSDSDEESILQHRVLEDCVSSRVLNRGDCSSSYVKSEDSKDYVSSHSQSKVISKLPKRTRPIHGLEPSADSVVSENPVPCGVQALNELGFLEHESFQFGKEHPSGSIWSDVLDFGDADGLGIQDTKAPRGKYCDLLPLQFEDHISSMKSEKEIDMDSISNRVNTSEELHKPCLETVNMSSEMEDDFIEHAEQLCHDVLDSNLSGKEYLENDPLSNENVQKPHFKSSKTTVAENIGTKFVTGFQSPGSVFSKVSRNRRSKEEHRKERKPKSSGKLCNILGSTPSDRAYVVEDPLISYEDVDCSKVTPHGNVGESEFLTSLIDPGKVMNVPHARRSKRKIGKERKHESRNFSRGLTDNRALALDEANEKIDEERKCSSHNNLSEMKTNGKIEKDVKPRFCKDSWEMEADRIIRKGRKRRYPNEFCETDDHSGEDVSFLVPEIKAAKSFIKRRIDLEYGRENVFYDSLEAKRAKKELEYRIKKRWLTKSFKAEKEKNDETVDDSIMGGAIKSKSNEVPTSETLYRDLSTIPYILKCNLQNRCRKCKNLNPCANANKKFKLFFTLTVGVGRRLSKPLMDTLQTEGDGSKISRTAAFIAASAAVSRPTTIIVPAFPEVVKKIIPSYHSNLLMQLVAETEEIDKMEKKTISDMAIAETLQLKRALIAMKARYFESRTMPDSPQSNQTTPDSESIILQSVQPGNPFTYKSNKIVAMKSKADNKFRFVKKCMVSLLPNKGAKSSEKDHNKYTYVSDNQLTDSQEVKSNGVEIRSNAKNDLPSMSQTHQSSIEKPSVPSTCDGENDDESMEPLLKKLLLDPSCKIKHLNSSYSKSSGAADPLEPVDTSKSPLVCMSLNKLQPHQPVDAVVVAENSDDVNCLRSHHNSSFSSGISSMDSGEVVDISAEDELDLNRAETRNVITSVAQTPTCAQELAKTNECLPSNNLKVTNPSLAVTKQLAPVIEGSKSQLANLLSSNSTRGNTKHSLLQDSVQKSGTVLHKNNPRIASEESPDVILIPDEFESIDLTAGEEETCDTDESAPNWAVICTSLPELGFIKVRKTKVKLIIYDKAVVSEPLEVNTIAELNKFLNSRLANLTFSYQSRIALEWILVTSGYLSVNTIPPTNPLFWLPSVTARKTLTDIRNFAKRYGVSQTYTKTRTVSTSGRRTSLSNAPTPKNGQTKLSVRPKLNVVSTCKKLTKLNIDTAGKIVRINGQMVVMGTPISYSKTLKDIPNPSSSVRQTVVPQVSSAEIVSSANSAPVSSPVISKKPLVGSTPLLTPVNRFLVVTKPSFMPFTNGPQPVEPGLIYTNSPSGYVRLASNPASSVVQVSSPACSNKSSSAVSKQQSSSSPVFLVLPTTATSSSQSSSFQLTPSQPVMVNSTISSAAGGTVSAPMHLTLSSDMKNSNTPTTASGFQQTTAFRMPSVPSGSRSLTPSSLPARKVVQTTTIRRPFRQIVVTPGSVKCMNLTKIAPGAISTSDIVLETSTEQSSEQTGGPSSAAPKPVSPVPVPHQVTDNRAAQQVQADSTPIQLSAGPVLPIQESSESTPKQVAALPPPDVPVTLTTVTPNLTSSPKPLTRSVCASTALSQKLAEALSQKLGQKFNYLSNPSRNNRQIFILRKDTSRKGGTSNPIRLAFQKPEIPASLPTP